MKPILFDAFTALDRAGARWCLLRGGDDLDRPAGDVDVLVHPHDLTLARSALENVGYLTQRTWAHSTQCFLLGRNRSDGAFVLLHITTVVSFGAWYALRPVNSAGVIARSTSSGTFRVAAATDEFWISLLHCVLDKEAVAPKHRLRLPALAREVESAGIDLAATELAMAVDARGGASWRSPAVIDLVLAGRWDELLALGTSLRRRWMRSDPASWVRLAFNAGSLSAHKIAEPFTHRGTSVALLAPDGAGKSTISAALSDRLPRPTRTIYMGAYGTGTPGGRSSIKGVGTVVRGATLWIRWLRAQWHLSRRRFVVFDRHPVELRLGQGGGRTSDLRRRVLASVPLPHLVVVLDVPAEVLRERKPEHSIAEFARRRARYLQLAHDLPTAIIIDGDRPIEHVVDDVIAALWQRHLERA